MRTIANLLLLGLLSLGSAQAYTVVGQAENSAVTAVTSMGTSSTLNVAAHDRLEVVVVTNSTVTQPTVSDTAGTTFAYLGTVINPLSGYYMYAYEAKDAAANSADTITASTSPDSNVYAVATLQLRGMSNSSAAVVAGNSQAAPGTAADAITSGTATPGSAPAVVVGLSCAINWFGGGANAAPTGGTGFTAESPIWATGGGGAGDYIALFETKEVTNTSAVAATFTATKGGANYGTLEWIVPEASSGGTSKSQGFFF